MSEREHIEFSLEELNFLSKLLSEAYLRVGGESTCVVEAEVLSTVQSYQLVDLEIIGYIDLDTISSASLGVLDPLGQLYDFIVSVFNTIASWIVSSVNTFIENYVMPSLRGIYDALTYTILPAFGNVINAVTTNVKGFIDTYILPAISNISSVVSNAISTVTVSIIGFIDTRVLPSFSWLLTSISALISTHVVPPLTSIYGMVVEGYSRIAELVSVGFDAVSRTFMGFVNAVLQLPALFWGTVPDWVRMGLHYITVTFAGFSTFITRPVESLVAVASGVMARVVEFATAMWSNFKYVWGILTTVVAGVLRDAWSGIASLVAFTLDATSKALRGIGEIMLMWVVSSVSALGEAFMKTVATLTSGLITLARMGATHIGQAVTGIAGEVFMLIYDKYSSSFMAKIPEMVERLKALSSPEPEILETIRFTLQGMGFIFLEIIGAHWMLWGVSQFMHWLASYCDELRAIPQTLLEGEGGCALEPIGLGARLRSMLGFIISLGWHLKPSYILRELAADMRQLSDTFTRGLFYGLTIWMTNPIVRLLNVAFRDILVIELPSIDMMMEIVRRRMPTPEFEGILREYRTMLKLYGHRSSVIDWITSLEAKIEVKDRFGRARVIPLSLIYQLPSASDVARMCIRDIFGMGKDAISSFLKVYSARGMHEDVGILYYLLHYRYPPPERLWTFVVRGWSGMLWATIPQDLMRSIEEEASVLGAAKPTDARYWNFKARELWTALQMYMTWHDYFRASWIPSTLMGVRILPENFTSDNQIMLDTLADIPGKIDQRWLVKWGLYEYMSSRGVAVDSPVRDFAVKVLDDMPKSGITLDLTNFARTLQATGLHPDWVPITAVAETMNVLSDERTLLRTGFMGLFKEGFYDLTAVEDMLRGFITVSFKVAYFDSAEMGWVKDKWVNVPVMFLPAERRLIELRALMDRALDILREIQRDVSLAYQDNIIPDYETYRERLSRIIDRVNEVYARDWEKVTGVRLPDGLKLKFVEDYYKPYVEGLLLYRDVYTVRRIRSWTMRWLGWIMYRVATGLVTAEELTRLVDTLVKYSRLTDVERKFFMDVFDAMTGVTIREYAPTPQQIATLSEYIVIPNDYVEKVFKVKMIGEEWQPIWRQYISVRPIADDIKALLNTYRRVSLYVKIPDEVERKVMEYAKLINFTEKELEIMHLRNQLEELLLDFRESKREYIPSPITLASISEILPEARDYFADVVKAKRIPEAWQKLWWRYIEVRPLIDEIRKYVSRVEQLYARFMIEEDAFMEVLNTVASLLGYERDEVDFILNIGRLERHRYAWTELIGDVDRMTMLAEYSPEARGFALATLNKMIDALPIPIETKNVLKKMWEQFIRIKPVKEEVTMYVRDLINAYIDGTISWELYTSELEELREWGLDDYEIAFYKTIAKLRKARKLRITIG